LTQQGTRHYAKRQLTWFRREKDILWIDRFGHDPAAEEIATQHVKTLLWNFAEHLEQH
jgi:tRNA dimethylallyltransferase